MIFGKILKNECEETFRITMEQTKKEIEELLESKIRKNYKSKSETLVRQMISECKEAFMDEWLWKEMLEDMFEKEYAEQLIISITEYITNREKDEANAKPKERMMKQAKDTTLKIEYIVFQKLLLDFQVKNHEIYLSKFTKLFKTVDKDTDGILNEDELRSLILSSGWSCDEKAMLQMLNELDPNNHQKITYSDCACIFAQQHAIEYLNSSIS